MTPDELQRRLAELADRLRTPAAVPSALAGAPCPPRHWQDEAEDRERPEGGDSTADGRSCAPARRDRRGHIGEQLLGLVPLLGRLRALQQRDPELHQFLPVSRLAPDDAPKLLRELRFVAHPEFKDRLRCCELHVNVFRVEQAVQVPVGGDHGRSILGVLASNDRVPELLHLQRPRRPALGSIAHPFTMPRGPDGCRAGCALDRAAAAPIRELSGPLRVA